MTPPFGNNDQMAPGKQKPPIIGYRQVWSKDRNILLQVFTDLETDSIRLVRLDKRGHGLGLWESLIEVEVED